MRELYVDIQPYKEQMYGVVTSHRFPPNGSCDNGLLFTAEYIDLLWRRFKAMQPSSVEDFTDYCSELTKYNMFLQACEQESGLIRRYPSKIQDQQFDDYVGAAAVNSLFAKRALDYGRKNKYCWNIERPGKFELNYFFGRLPGFVPYLRAAANVRIGIIGAILWSLSTVFAALQADGKETSGVKLQFLQNGVMERRKSIIAKLAIKFWRYKLKKKFPNGMQDVWAIYFGPEHPLTKHSFPDFLNHR